MKLSLSSRQQRYLNVFSTVLGAGIVMCLFANQALAEGDIEGTVDTVIQKIQSIVQKVAGAILVIGLIVVGLKFSRGDQSAQQHAIGWGIGAMVVYAASEILRMFGAS